VRLPTEAEWEYACRAGSTTPFYFGETISTDQANYDGRETYGKGSRGKHRIRTMPGASFPANAWGLCEMHGNAWEWCQSLDREYPYRADDGREDLKAQGRRVLRGGSWTEEPKGCRSASRNPADPHDRCINVGFRVVVE
jgi:formylglycine-generating enzyme required for sulfatase activity